MPQNKSKNMENQDKSFWGDIIYFFTVVQLQLCQFSPMALPCSASLPTPSVNPYPVSIIEYVQDLVSVKYRTLMRRVKDLNKLRDIHIYELKILLSLICHFFQVDIYQMQSNQNPISFKNKEQICNWSKDRLIDQCNIIENP